MAFTTKCHCHRQERVAGTLYIFNFDESRRRRRMPGFQENNWHPNCFKIKAGDSNPKEKLSIIRERARERRRQIKAMLSNRPACCFVCVCVCGFVVSSEKTVFKRHRRRERKKSFLHLPSARCNGFKALQRSKPREAGGCRCLQSPELRVQESFTDTIAFNQLFSGEIAGVIMEFFKKFKRRAGGRAADPTQGEKKAAYRRRGQHKAKAFHI